MKVDEKTLAVLSSSEITGRHLKLTENLSRGDYMRVDKVLTALGGKWDRKLRTHVFTTAPRDVIDQAIATGEIIDAKKDFGFFETPVPLARELVELAGNIDGMHVLEPSAGRGAIAHELRARGAHVTCVEILPYNANHLEAEHDGQAFEVVRGDFLEMRPSEFYQLFKRVVMNPPFGKSADAKHVLHARSFLKPNGKLIAIMAAGVKFRRDALATEVRSLASKITDLPNGSFRESGTDVRAVIVEMSV